MIPISTNFPNSAQQAFTPLTSPPLIGDVWAGEINNPGVQSYYIPRIVEEAQVTSITLGANAPGDTLTITIDGVSVNATAGADLAATSAAVEAAIEAAALFASLVTVTVASPVVTLTFADFDDHTVAVASSGATTIVAAPVNAAVSNAKLDFGMWVAKRAPVGSFLSVAGQPSATTDLFAGVLFRVPGARPFTATQAQILGQSTDWLPVGLDYAVATKNMGIVVEFSGAAPTMLDPVYRVCAGADYGKWAASDLSVAGTNEVVTLTLVTDGGTPGVSQESTLTVVSVADGDVGFSYDGLPALSLTATGNAVNDAASLFALYLANASYMAVTDSITDNLDGTLTIVFSDSALHTFADASTGTSSVAENIDVANVPDVPGDLVSFNYDGLPDLVIAEATGVVATDAANFYAQWIANASYNALGSIVDNLDGTLTITFADFTTHTLTDNSGGTSTVTEAVDVAADAGSPPLAVLMPDFSWGHPSITGQPNEPDRAFLLLSPS